MILKTDMDDKKLQQLLKKGEDSTQQFKRNFSNIDSLAAEMIAFANSAGGLLIIGVDDNGTITGLSGSDIARLNQLISNAASQRVRPPVNPFSRNVDTSQGLVMIVEIPQGVNRPYMDIQGRIWVKSGADKRHVTAREEMQRLFQQSGLVYADEVPVSHSSSEDLNIDVFNDYFERRYRKPVKATGLSLNALLQNLNLASSNMLNLTGWMLFSKSPQTKKPAFIIKAVAFPGNVLHDNSYIDSEDLSGTLPEQFQKSIAFIKRNLHHIQGKQGFNSPGQLEIPETVFEELLVNALIHRDYFVSAPIRLLIFKNRVEIISPGKLPNHLDIEQIFYGISNIRNPALASHGFYILPYKGIGSGIPRAKEAWPNIEFINDTPGCQFKVIIKRIYKIDL